MSYLWIRGKSRELRCIARREGRETRLLNDVRSLEDELATHSGPRYPYRIAYNSALRDTNVL
jgi:hypothetical protein